MSEELSPEVLEVVGELYKVAALVFGSLTGVQWAVGVTPSRYGPEIELRASLPRVGARGARHWRLTLTEALLRNMEPLGRERLRKEIILRVRSLRDGIRSGEMVG